MVFSSYMQSLCSHRHGMYRNSWFVTGMSTFIAKEMSSTIQSLDPMECPWNMVDSAAWELLEEESFVNHWLLNNLHEEATRLTSKDLVYEGREGVLYMNAFDVFKRGCAATSEPT